MDKIVSTPIIEIDPTRNIPSSSPSSQIFLQFE